MFVETVCWPNSWFWWWHLSCWTELELFQLLAHHCDVFYTIAPCLHPLAFSALQCPVGMGLVTVFDFVIIPGWIESSRDYTFLRVSTFVELSFLWSACICFHYVLDQLSIFSVSISDISNLHISVSAKFTSNAMLRFFFFYFMKRS